MTERPLHVRVAEVLGWDMLRHFHRETWRGRYPEGYGYSSGRRVVIVPRYDKDWSATGPLIEKYDICIRRDEATKEVFAWVIGHGRPYGMAPPGQDLIAVCNLILKLGEGGCDDRP